MGLDHTPPPAPLLPSSAGDLGLAEEEVNADGGHHHPDERWATQTLAEEEEGLMSCRRRHKVEQAGHSRDGAGESGSTALAFE